MRLALVNAGSSTVSPAEASARVDAGEGRCQAPRMPAPPNGLTALADGSADELPAWYRRGCGSLPAAVDGFLGAATRAFAAGRDVA